MNRSEVVLEIIRDLRSPTKSIASAFAPTNIALCKYWGKRNVELNLPFTSSLSISLGHLGATTKISIADTDIDLVTLNGMPVASNTVFYRRLLDFIDLFRPKNSYSFKIDTVTNIPIAAGLASSACGFAAVVKALNEIFSWHLSLEQLSIVARLGSGSACRSLWSGFVQWDAGIRSDGMDSYARILDYVWPSLRVGLLLVDDRQKSISSREAMQATVETSPFYSLWPKVLDDAIKKIHIALSTHNFYDLGSITEANALAMHSLMLSTTPPIIYSQAVTLDYMQQIWAARASGLNVFFTQDAGPNLKLLFLDKDESKIREMFAGIEVIAPFAEIQEAMELNYDN